MTANADSDLSRGTTEIFSHVRQLVTPRLRLAVAEFSDEMRSMAEYHFGWADERGLFVEGGGGKMIRAALALLSAEAVGGRTQDGVPAAVAIELVHEHSLLHDDVIDQDALRRHRKAVWAVFGVPAAILLGDALLCRAFRVLCDGHDTSDTGAQLLSAAAERMIHGQNSDIRLEARAEPIPMEECVAMTSAKTAALMGCACALGALRGGANPTLIRHMADFGENMGMAFQFVDDLLGIWGEPMRTGKSARSDLQRRKKSLPVVFALNSDSSVAEELATLYQLPRDLSAHELDRAAELVEECGARVWAQREADRYTRQALTMLAADQLNQPALQQLTTLAGLISRRKH